jgi:D-alanine transaminase
MQWAFLDGRFIPKMEKAIALEERGLTFGDGLFEVLRTINGKILFFNDHLNRMKESAAFFGYAFPWPLPQIEQWALELIKRNQIQNGELYIQLTRGEDQNREHRYPPRESLSTFFMLALPLRKINAALWEQGAKVIPYPDLRHGLCVHKTINLLANVIAKNHAYRYRGYEALMYRTDPLGSIITEGGSSSYFGVSDLGVVTPKIDNILPGITRKKVIGILTHMHIPVIERKVLLSEYLSMKEVFLVSTVSKVMPIHSIGNRSFDAPGPITLQIQKEYEQIFLAELS